MRCSNCGNHIKTNDINYPINCRYFKPTVESKYTYVAICVTGDYIKGNRAESCPGFIESKFI